jgi:hypothetical protein
MKLDLIRKHGQLFIRHWIFDRLLMFNACQSQCRCYLVSLFGNEIVMLSVNTHIKLYHKLLDLLLYIYIYAAEIWTIRGKE